MHDRSALRELFDGHIFGVEKLVLYLWAYGYLSVLVESLDFILFSEINPLKDLNLAQWCFILPCLRCVR